MSCLAVDLAEVELVSPGDYTGMSNFDNRIESDTETRLARGESVRHAGWEFNGLVVQAPNGQFVEWVYRYHSVICMHTAPSLRDLMDQVNDAHGWE